MTRFHTTVYLDWFRRTYGMEPTAKNVRSVFPGFKGDLRQGSAWVQLYALYGDGSARPLRQVR